MGEYLYTYSFQPLTRTVFKQSFHLGDAEPYALSRYVEHKFMIDAMDEFIMSGSINSEPFELCKTMRMADMFREERRIVDDAFKAYASIAVFFEGDAFLASEYGEPWKETKLLDQEERAKQVPDRRTHLSNKSMPKEFWKDWDDLLKEHKRSSGDIVDDIYPMEWRKALRPIIIKRKLPLSCSVPFGQVVRHGGSLTTRTGHQTVERAKRNWPIRLLVCRLHSIVHSLATHANSTC